MRRIRHSWLCVAVAAARRGIRGRLAAVPRSIGLRRGDGAKPPVKWDATKGTNIVWSVEIPGLADSSPIVWGDRIFVTTAVSSDPKQTFRTGLYGDTDPVNDSSPHKWVGLCHRQEDRKNPVATDRPRRCAQDEAAPQVVAGFAVAGDQR
jgi:hypothetical protein